MPCDRLVGIAPRTPRSSPCSPAACPAGSGRDAGRRGQGGRVAPDRLVVRSWGRSTGSPGVSCAKRAPSAPDDLELQAVLAPGRDLADDHRAEHAAVGLGTWMIASVLRAQTAAQRAPARRRRRERLAPGPGPRARARRSRSARTRPRSARRSRTRRGRTSASRCRRTPATRRSSAAVDPPVVVLGRRAASPADRRRGRGARRRSRPPRPARGPRAPSGSSGRRTAPSATRARRVGARRRAARPRVSTASGFSHTTCLPAAQRRHGQRARGGRWACRCARRRRRRRRRPPRRAERVGHAEPAAAASRPRSGARRGHPDDLGPGHPRRPHMHGTDEAGRADDRGPQPPAGGAQNGTPSSAFLASTSMPCRRARFSPRILRLACSVSCG